MLTYAHQCPPMLTYDHHMSNNLKIPANYFSSQFLSADCGGVGWSEEGEAGNVSNIVSRFNVIKIHCCHRVVKIEMTI